MLDHGRGQQHPALLVDLDLECRVVDTAAAHAFLGIVEVVETLDARFDVLAAQPAEVYTRTHGAYACLRSARTTTPSK